MLHSWNCIWFSYWNFQWFLRLLEFCFGVIFYQGRQYLWLKKIVAWKQSSDYIWHQTKYIAFYFRSRAIHIHGLYPFGLAAQRTGPHVRKFAFILLYVCAYVVGPLTKRTRLEMNNADGSDCSSRVEFFTINYMYFDTHESVLQTFEAHVLAGVWFGCAYSWNGW